MSARISSDNLADEIIRIMADSAEEYGEALEKTLEEEAKKGAQEVRANAEDSFGAGKYSAGWKAEKVSDRSWVIRNRTRYMLTHLLEKGHDVVRNGKVCGHYGGKPHIAQVEKKISDRIAKTFEGKIK